MQEEKTTIVPGDAFIVTKKNCLLDTRFLNDWSYLDRATWDEDIPPWWDNVALSTVITVNTLTIRAMPLKVSHKQPTKWMCTKCETRNTGRFGPDWSGHNFYRIMWRRARAGVWWECSSFGSCAFRSFLCAVVLHGSSLLMCVLGRRCFIELSLTLRLRCLLRKR
jgi:hypothetical protein